LYNKPNTSSLSSIHSSALSTDTNWSQVGGQGIVGELTGLILEPVSIDTVAWRDWKALHPDSEVLSKDTGFLRQYGQDPYGNYYEDSFLLFPVEGQDNRIHAKTIIFGIELNGTFKAYKESDFENVSMINDVLGGIEIKLEKDEAGAVKITRLENGQEIVKERSFWFAWYAFHPDTDLYQIKGDEI